MQDLKAPVQSQLLTRISLTLVGLMWVFPFLHYQHQYPLTTFYQEWWSALLGVLALIPLAARGYWQQPEIPRIVQLPIGLIAVLLLQSVLGKVAYFDQVMLYALYLLFAAMLMMLGARLRTLLGMAKLALVLAIFLLIGAELSALIGVLQHYRLHTPLDTVIAMKSSSSVFGNLAQPNHYANYIALGLASLGLLYQQQRLKAVYATALAAPLLFVMTLSGSRSAWLYLLMMAGLAWWWTRRDAGQRPLLRYSLSLIAGFGVMHLVVQLPFMTAAVSNFDTVQRLFDDTSGNIRLYLWCEAGLIFMQSPYLGVGFGQFAWHHFQLLPSLRQGNIVGLYNNAHNLIFQLAAEAGVAGLLILSASLGVWLRGLKVKLAQRDHELLALREISSDMHACESGRWPASNDLAVAAGQPDQMAGSFTRCPAGDGVFPLPVLSQPNVFVSRAPLDAAHWWGYVALGVLAIHSLLEYPLWYTYFVAVAAFLLGALDETSYRLELRNVGRMSAVAILLMGLMTLVQLRSDYHQLERALNIRPASAAEHSVYERMRDGLIAVQGGSLLSTYAELFMSSLIEVNSEHLKEKLELNTRVMHFAPIGAVVYRQTLLLAQANRQEEAQVILVQAIWSYPGDFSNALQQMTELTEKDPAHYSALLEFALQKEQEYQRAVRY